MLKVLQDAQADQASAKGTGDKQPKPTQRARQRTANPAATEEQVPTLLFLYGLIRWV